MPSFTPPTQQQGVRTGDRLFDRYTVPVGLSVVRSGGSFATTPYPWLGDLDGLEEGTDYFLGGRTYVVTDAVAAELTAAGYTVVDEAGYGIDPYGSGGFGS